MQRQDGTGRRESDKAPGGASRGFLARLVKDKKASVLPIMAASMIPLLGVIGAGLDLSRGYLSKAKLQTACDAAALATRRHMANAVELTESSKAEGRKFFAFNFPTGTMQTAAITPTIRQNTTDLSVVEVEATAQVPTTLMRMFGKRTMVVKATCSADQDFVNNDIMLVLDVTMSMNCVAGTTCSYQASEQTGSRLSRLRTAAKSLYNALKGATGVRTRYGFVPYSMTVNVGHSIDNAYLQTKPKYHKCKVFNLSNNKPTTCKTWDTDAEVDKTGVLDNKTAWPGCIEERSSIGVTDESKIILKGTVSKEDIDTVGTTKLLKWSPYDPAATTGHYDGTNAKLAAFCPAESSKLRTYSDEAAFQTQLNASLTGVGGYTNHDLGMIWGMRFLSGGGMFATENPDFYKSGGVDVRVDRHIVFMTDGEMTTSDNSYSSFGVPAKYDRFEGSAADVAKHNTRFLAACDRARQMKMTIWVIALDVGSTGEIKKCASGDDHFFISNGTDLDKIFTTIGKGIGKLRVVK